MHVAYWVDIINYIGDEIILEPRENLSLNFNRHLELCFSHGIYPKLALIIMPKKRVAEK